MDTIFFNAHHSPIGALSTFTLGCKGAKGGFGTELKGPANQSVFIGVESVDRSHYDAFPFYDQVEDASGDFDVERVSGKASTYKKICPFTNVKRQYNPGSDVWQAGDITFTLYTQAPSITDPSIGDENTLALDIFPGILAEITVDNRANNIKRRGFFGYEGNDPYAGMRRLEGSVGSHISGVGQGGIHAIASTDPNIISGMGFTMETILSEKYEENLGFGLGNIGALMFDVPAGEKKTFHFVLAFYRQGIVTSGISARYYYTKFFSDIDEVCQFGCHHYFELRDRSYLTNNEFNTGKCSDEEYFLLTHAIHSYYGNTQLLIHMDKPLWTVWEGEYRMMNTFDLMVDQLFFEMRKNPWTVRNELEQFAGRYHYTACVHFPGDRTKYDGGVSFSHDMGMGNVFTRPGHSSYERQGLHGCFSYMTAEQLVNWVLCALVYIEQTNDTSFYERYKKLIQDCMISMVRRDHPDSSRRTGIVQMDTCRASGGSEITTYDSLDISLGQARNNLYLASKYFAAYVSLYWLFSKHEDPILADLAKEQSRLCANTILSHVNADGSIPAVFENDNNSMIIPAVEGLVFLPFTGCREALNPEGTYGALIKALKKHLKTVLVPGVCISPTGGWKLSSTSRLAFPSKIILCEYVATHLLHMDIDVAVSHKDMCHWQQNDDSNYWCFSDQFVDGKAVGSKYYPRGVTSILWLYE